MISRTRRLATFSCTAFLLATAGNASAQPRPDATTADAAPRDRCERVELDVSASLSSAWRDAADALRAELARSHASCVTARLSLETAPNDAARLLVTTPDGRQTERVVERPALLVSTAIGVVASLPSDPRSPADLAAMPPPPQPADEAPPIVAQDAGDASTAKATSSSTTHVWVGVSGGARIAQPTFLGMIDMEGHATLEIDQWLILASIRYGSSMGEALVSTDDSYDELAGGLGIGRRFLLCPAQFEVALLPSLVSATLGDDDETGDAGSARTELRVGALLGWSMTTEDGWRVTVTADTDVTPRGFDRPVRSSDTEPPLPVWTAALRLGAAGRIL